MSIFLKIGKLASARLTKYRARVKFGAGWLEGMLEEVGVGSALVTITDLQL